MPRGARQSDSVTAVAVRAECVWAPDASGHRFDCRADWDSHAALVVEKFFSPKITGLESQYWNVN